LSEGNRAQSEITLLLKEWSAGDAAALSSLAPIVYSELRRIARGLLHRERPGHTLQSAALVNEAWLRLTRISEVDCANRTLFLGLCAELMRRILVDYARSRLRL
jgi:RNA polymerase sigma factor (TIGR02999 family)